MNKVWFFIRAVLPVALAAPAMARAQGARLQANSVTASSTLASVCTAQLTSAAQRGAAPANTTARDSAPSLAGIWDMRIEIGTNILTGSMMIGHMDGAYAGALTPDSTNSVVIRKLTLVHDSVHMSVATPEGEVRFDGMLAGIGNAMCGIVTYHGGVKYPMAAVKRARPRTG